MEVEQLDESLYNAFWHEVQQLRYDIDFFDVQSDYSLFWSRIIKYVMVGLTTSATLVWMQYEQNTKLKNICIVVIIVAQIITAISELFPYDKRQQELHDLSHELEYLFVDIETDWRKVQSLDYNNQEISELLNKYQKKELDIQSHYLKEDTLPEYECLIKKAEKKTEAYFKYSYGEEYK